MPDEAKKINVDDLAKEVEELRKIVMAIHMPSPLAGKITSSTLNQITESSKPVTSKTTFKLTFGEIFSMVSVIAAFLLGYYDLKSGLSKSSTDISEINNTVSSINTNLDKISARLDRQGIVLETVLLRDSSLRKEVDLRIKANEKVGK